MAAETNQELHDAIIAFIRKNGGIYTQYYLGITADARKRLFTDHLVPENKPWIYGEAISADAARELEAFMIDKYKFDGGPGGGDNTTKFVYAYLKINGVTNP